MSIKTFEDFDIGAVIFEPQPDVGVGFYFVPAPHVPSLNDSDEDIVHEAKKRISLVLCEMIECAI